MRRRSASGKRALVTGGSSGIGRHVALELAQRGAKVAEDRLASAEKELQAISSDAFACLCDVGSREDIDRMAAIVRGRIGGVQVLINNAGFATYRTFSGSDPSELEDIVNVNLLGVICCMRALVADMIRQRSGVIPNLASIAGRLPLTPSGRYAAAKHGVDALSQILDDELARFDIPVCVVCPGRVQTSFFATALPARPPSSPTSTRQPPRRHPPRMPPTPHPRRRTHRLAPKPSNSPLDTSPSWDV